MIGIETPWAVDLRHIACRAGNCRQQSAPQGVLPVLVEVAHALNRVLGNSGSAQSGRRAALRRSQTRSASGPRKGVRDLLTENPGYGGTGGAVSLMPDELHLPDPLGEGARLLQEAAVETSTLVGGAIGILIALLLIALLVVVFRWLWNTTMPEVFGARSLTFWQALKILLLAGILFGGHRVVDVPQQVSEESAPTARAAK